MDHGAPHELGQVIDAVGHPRADVEHLPAKWGTSSSNEAIDDVTDKRKIPGLGPVSNYCEGLTSQLLGKEHAKDSTVGT